MQQQQKTQIELCRLLTVDCAVFQTVLTLSAGRSSISIIVNIVIIIKQRMSLVAIEYNLNGEKKSIKINGSVKPFNTNEVAEDAETSNTSFGYSGRHDHGILPQMKSDGSHAILVSALIEAKKECDKFLTAAINEETKNNNSPAKKQKIKEESEELEDI